MAKKKGKKKKININKKKLNKIEFAVIAIILIMATLIFFNTRTLSQEKANKLVYEEYIETEEVLSKVLIGTDWLILSEECASKDGYTVCKSETNNMTKYDDLKEYINSVCTKELTDKILKEREIVYRNIDEELYVLNSRRNTDVFYAGIKEIKPVTISSHEIKSQVVCNYYIDLETKELYTMSYDFVIEKSFGKWKSSYFELPY